MPETLFSLFLILCKNFESPYIEKISLHKCTMFNVEVPGSSPTTFKIIFRPKTDPLRKTR